MGPPFFFLWVGGREGFFFSSCVWFGEWTVHCSLSTSTVDSRLCMQAFLFFLFWEGGCPSTSLLSHMLWQMLSSFRKIGGPKMRASVLQIRNFYVGRLHIFIFQGVGPIKLAYCSKKKIGEVDSHISNPWSRAQPRSVVQGCGTKHSIGGWYTSKISTLCLSRWVQHLRRGTKHIICGWVVCSQNFHALSPHSSLSWRQVYFLLTIDARVCTVSLKGKHVLLAALLSRLHYCQDSCFTSTRFLFADFTQCQQRSCCASHIYLVTSVTMITVA